MSQHHHITLTHCSPGQAVGRQLSTDTNDGDWHCFACGKSGSMVILVNETPDVPTTAAAPAEAE